MILELCDCMYKDVMYTNNYLFRVCYYVMSLICVNPKCLTVMKNSYTLVKTTAAKAFISSAVAESAVSDAFAGN